MTAVLADYAKRTMPLAPWTADEDFFELTSMPAE